MHEKSVALDDIVLLTDGSDISSIKRIVAGILSMINNPRSTAKELKELIEVDPPLTAKLLKTANSAYYSSGRRIGDIEEAVIWVGFDELKELALRQKVCEIFLRGESIGAYFREALWKHSVSTAILAKMIYRREFCEKGDSMYAAALIHDIGIIVEDQFLHDEFREILRRVERDRLNLIEAEEDMLGYNHAQIGEALCTHWDFPPDFVRSIGNHQGPFSEQCTYSRMELTLYVANHLCHVNRIGYNDTIKIDTQLYRKCLNTLGLDEIVIGIIMDDLYEEISLLEKQGMLLDGGCPEKNRIGR